MIKKIVLVLLLSLFSQTSIYVSGGESDDKAEDAYRMVVYANEGHYYKVKSDSFFSFPEKFSVTDKIFGSKINPREILTNSFITRYPGLQFGFVHPSYAGFSKGVEKNITLSDYRFAEKTTDGSYKESPLMLTGKATWTNSGWKYILKTAKVKPTQIYVEAAVEDERFFALINDMELEVSGTFDVKKERVSLISIKYKWDLAAPDQEDPILPKKKGKSTSTIPLNAARIKIIENWDDKYSGKVSLRYGGEEKIKPPHKKTIISNPRHAKALDLGTKYLINELSREETWKLGGSKDSWKVGSYALAIFAILRAEEDPEDPVIERILLRYCDFAKKIGYTKTGAPVDRCGYAAGCCLMMIEAALNPNDSDGGIITKKKGSKKKAIQDNFRCSFQVQEELRTLANTCLRFLNAQGKTINSKYGNQTGASAQNGHLWHYDGSRAFAGGPHYSPAQYAVLGIRCAKLIGLDVPDDVWEDIHKGVIDDFLTLEEALKVFGEKADKHNVLAKVKEVAKTSKLDMEFEEDGLIVKSGYKQVVDKGVGMWGYRKSTHGHGYASLNMVCSALGNVAMAYSFLPDAAKPEMKDQMMMGLHYCQIVLDHLYEHLELYEYYSWERVAVFYGVKKVKGRDWHFDMSEKICDAQNEATGKFTSKGHSAKAPLMNTAYAVLFLKKATKKLGYTIK